MHFSTSSVGTRTRSGIRQPPGQLHVQPSVVSLRMEREMSCITHTAIAVVPPAQPRVRRPWPRPVVAVLIFWEAFLEAREMRNAAQKAFPFNDE